MGTIIIITPPPPPPGGRQAEPEGELADTLRHVADQLDSGDYKIAKPKDGRK